jgi:hypothetical protein
MIPLALDDKNVMTDALAEELFDEGEYVERVHELIHAGRHDLLGFVFGSPVMVSYKFGSNVLHVTDFRGMGNYLDEVYSRVCGSIYHSFKSADVKCRKCDKEDECDLVLRIEVPKE